MLTPALVVRAQAPFIVPGAPKWQWQNPRPAGYHLTDVHVFDDQSALAIGDHGLAMKTTDQGLTWSQLSLGMDYNLKSVSFLNPLVGWVAYNTPPPPLPNIQTGRGEVRKTTDGGQSWTVQLIGEPGDVEMQSLRFLSATEGYVHYYYNHPGANRPARLRVTHNGGQSWTAVPIPDPTKAVQFVTPLVGYLVGPGFVQKTTNGGLTFTDVTPPGATGIEFNQLSFLDAQMGWVSSSDGSVAPNFYRTTNGGASWSPVQIYSLSPNYYSPATNLYFSDALHGTAGQRVTVDGGQTWTTGQGIFYQGITKTRPSGVGFSVSIFGQVLITNDFGVTGRRGDQRLFDYQSITRVNFPDPVRGWAFGGDSPGIRQLYQTSNRGAQWQRLDVASRAPGVDWTYNGLQAGAFPDADTAYLAGNEYLGAGVQPLYVLKTVDAGQSWARLPLTGGSSANDLQFRDCRFGLLVGDLGEVWYTRTGGRRWQRGNSGTMQNLRTVCWADNTTAYARGDGSTFLKTVDGGATWQPVPNSFFIIPNRYTAVHLDFITPQLGFVSDGGLWRTADGGQTWTPISLPGSVRGVSFTSKREGWAYGGQVFHTTDAGQTWTPQADLGILQFSGSFIDRYNGWVVGDGNPIVRYSEKFIAASPLARSTYAPGETLALAFTTEGPFPASEQRFVAQLSNARGRFRAGQVRVVCSGTASPLAVTLPPNLPAGAAYRLRVVQADSLVLGGDTGQELRIQPAVLPDLVVSTAQTLPGGIYRNVTVTGTGTLNLTSDLEVNGTLLVQTGGVLATDGGADCAHLIGPGAFALAAGAELRICDATGISATGSAGAVQVVGSRSFSTDASYTYVGFQAQLTGGGLPGQVRNLAVDNDSLGLSLSQGVAVAQVLRLTAGDLTTAGQPLTLLSGPAGTALIDNTGGLVQGIGTMQRYLDNQNPAGRGYRHYSSPVRNTTVADLGGTGYTPVLNTAYNTSPTPGLVVPFPTLFSYSQNRLNTSPATGGRDFDKGWVVPSSLTSILVTGVGYTANAPNAALVDFTGPFTSGPVMRGSLNRGPQADAGWQLVGNPYPSPLDWSSVAPSQRPDLDAAAYVFQSTGPYTGNYRSCINGFGDPLIAAGSGFFVRTTAAGVPADLTFTDANRITTFGAQPAFGRGAADVRPRLHLLLTGAGSTDETWLYLQAGATPGPDAEYDATKLPNPTGLNLASVNGTVAFAINGRPLPGSQEEVIPLTVEVPQAGSFSFAVEELANFGTTTVYLRDALTGTQQLLSPQSRYAFTLPTAAVGSGRFSLVLRPGGALANAAPFTAVTVRLYPNPAHGSFRLALPPVPGEAQVQATLLNAVGQVVRHFTVPLGPAGAEAELAVPDLPAGVYALRLTSGKQLYVQRVVLE